MNFKIVVTSRFEKEAKRLIKKYPSLKAEFVEVVHHLSQNPSFGSALGNNCFKVRMAIKSKGKGKSGGARLITYVYSEHGTLYLLTIYDKGEKQDLRPGELVEMVRSLKLD